MGLLLKLENGDTALKSLKFGKDRPGGGDSGQPYIQSPILDNPPPESVDFLLRGGLNAPIDAAEDVVRLTKYMFDFKSPSGLLFVAKQNLLSRIAPKTEASKGIGYAGGALNEGVYTPLSTLAQAGVGFAGIHLNKQGIDPTGLIPGLSINSYDDIVKNQTTGENRLVNILTNSVKNLNGVKGYDINQGQDMITYGGGPGSILGIGKTHIRYADQRTGINNPLAGGDEPNKKYFYKGGIKLHDEDDPNIILGVKDDGTIIITSGLGASKKQGLDDSQIGITENNTFDNSISGILYNYTQPNSTLSKNSLGLTLSGSYGYQIGASGTSGSYKTPTAASDTTYKSQIQQILDGYGREEISPTIFDEGNISGEARTWAAITSDVGSRKFIPKYSSVPSLTIDLDAKDSGLNNTEISDKLNASEPESNKKGYLANLNKNLTSVEMDPETGAPIVLGLNPRREGGFGIAGDFRRTNRKKRGFFDDPNSYDRITDPKDYSSTTIDKIYYTSANTRTSTRIDSGKDLVKFRFDIINPTNTTDTDTLRFRAYIDNISDSYTPEWNSQTYMGRAEKFYKYNSFGRSISLGFTIVADNSTHLTIMYDQLNTLAASLAPTYTKPGYMAGNLHRLTIGNYISNQVGIIEGLTYEIIDDSPWNIVERELPMYIKVTGIKFTPIHNFRPESQFNGIHQFVNQ